LYPNLNGKLSIEEKMGEEREKSKTARMKGKKYEGRKGERKKRRKVMGKDPNSENRNQQN